MPSGRKCGSIALKDKPYCYAHTRLHKSRTAPPPGPMDTLQYPLLEDRTAIQIAVTQVLNALFSGNLDPKRVGLALYGLQIVSQNVDRKGAVIPFETVDSITESDTGEDMGPEKHICDPNKCFVCPERNTCDDCDLTEEEEQAAMAEVRQQHAAHQPLSNANRPKPAVNSAPPRPSTSSLVHCPSSLPTVQAVASRTHPAPLHFFTSSLVHFFTSVVNLKFIT